MSVTLADVAARAGVSRSAVSRTFTPGASVSAKTRAKVEAVADELGYRPNALAAGLTTGRTRLIGLVLNNFDNPLFLEVFDLFTRGLQERGLRPLLVNLKDQTDPAQSLEMLQQYSVDGVIVASSTLSLGFAGAFRQAGLRVVHSFGRVDSAAGVDVVGIDNVACGRMAAEALIAAGYRDIGFLGGPERATSTQDRLTGFRLRLEEEGVSPRIDFADDYTFDAGFAAMTRTCSKGLAEAYFCGDDILSLGAMRAVEAAGLTVPGDVGLIGLNDMKMAAWPGHDLTTIRQPVADIIRTSIDLVVNALDDPDREIHAIALPCELVIRGSLRAVINP